jgi:flagellar hook protein FlgE
MSLMTALYSGASGLETSSLELSVVGDNIANGNTVGFKGSRAAFSDAMAQNLIGDTGVDGGQRGLGVKLQVVQKILTQGALVNTGNATDIGIEGSGFFAVNGTRNGNNGTFYTRAGQFTLDENGYLVTLGNMKVQGYTADSAGNINGASVGDLKVGTAGTSPRASTTVTMKANLQADAVAPPAWDVTNPSGTSNFVSSTTIYDSLGKAHQADVYFTKTSAPAAVPSAWSWHALTDGANLVPQAPGTMVSIADGTLEFGMRGELVTSTQNADFHPAGALDPQPLTFNFGDDTTNGGTGLTGITQFNAPSATTFSNSDGYNAGTLVRINFDTQGQIMGVFSNGQTRVLAEVALADFKAPDQMTRIGGNLYAESGTSGSPSVGGPGTGGRGQIVGGALEQSNVDMASEFIRMIASQRAFQANSKTLTTADSLLAELMTLKR